MYMRKQKNLNKFFQEKIFPGKNFKFLPNFEEEMKHIPSDPEIDLFYWCILSNRTEIAKIFWGLGKVKIRKYIDRFKTKFFSYKVSNTKCSNGFQIT